MVCWRCKMAFSYGSFVSPRTSLLKLEDMFMTVREADSLPGQRHYALSRT